MPRGRFPLAGLAVLLMCLLAPCVSAEPGWLNGVWDFYFECKAEGFRPFSNMSNVMEIAGYRGADSVVVRSRAILAPFYRKLPLKDLERSGPDFESNLAPAYSDAAKQKKLADYAAKIQAGALTLDELVDRTAVWVRDNIFYSLGSPTDPLGVISGKRAYCMGYAELFVALLRCGGLEARFINCYVPAGKGWGFGNSGGGHAFLEYFYPGHGWVSVDPQAELNFVDPYHLVGIGQSSIVREFGTFSTLADTGCQSEPAKWKTYDFADQRQGGVPRIFLKARDLDGDPVEAAYFKGESLRFPGLEGEGIRASDIIMKFDGWSDSRPGTNTDARKAFNLQIPPESQGSSLEIAFAAKDFLYLGTEALPLGGDIEVDIDFSEAEGIHAAYLIGDEGKAFPGLEVSLSIEGESWKLSPSEGRISILAPGHGEASLEAWGRSIKIDLSPGAPKRTVIFSSPEKEAGIRAKAPLPSPAPGTATLVCSLLGGSGLPSAFEYSSVWLYDLEGGSAKAPVPSGDSAHRKPAVFQGLKPGQGYIFAASAGNRHFIRRIDPKGEGLIELEADLGSANFRKLSHAESWTSLSGYFAYFGPKAVVPLAARKGTAFIDFPGDELLVSESKDASFARILRQGGTDSHDLVYDPWNSSFEDILEARGRLAADAGAVIGRALWLPVELSEYSSEFESLFSGRTPEDRVALEEAYPRKGEGYRVLRDDLASEERESLLRRAGKFLGGATVNYRNEADGKSGSVKADPFGVFSLPKAEPGASYLFYLLRGSCLIAARALIPDSGRVELRLDSTGPRIALPSDTGKPVRMIFPAAGLKNGSFESLLVANGWASSYAVLPPGRYWFGHLSAPQSVFPVDLGELSLGSLPEFVQDPGSEAWTSGRGEVLRELFPGKPNAAFVAISGLPEGGGAGRVLVLSPLAGGPEAAREPPGKGEIRLALDDSGIAFAESLPPGSYAAFLKAEGLYMERILERGEGSSTCGLALGEGRMFRVPGFYKGSFSRLRPISKNGILAYEEEPLEFPRWGDLSLSLGRGSYLFGYGNKKTVFELRVDVEAAREGGSEGKNPPVPQLPPGEALGRKERLALVSRIAEASLGEGNFLAIGVSDGGSSEAFAGKPFSVANGGKGRTGTFDAFGMTAVEVREGEEARLKISVAGYFAELFLARPADSPPLLDIDFSLIPSVEISCKAPYPQVFLAEPGAAGGKIGFAETGVAIQAERTLVAAEGRARIWLRMGPEKIPISADPASGKKRPRITWDSKKPPEKFASYEKLLASLETEKPIGLVGIKSASALKGAVLFAVNEAGERKNLPIQGNCAFLEGFAEGRYRLIYAEEGFAFERGIDLKLGGASILKIDLDGAVRTRLVFLKRKGETISLSVPYASGGSLRWLDFSLSPTKEGIFSLALAGESGYLKIGKTGALVEIVPKAKASTVEIDCAGLPDALPVLAKLYARLLPDSGTVFLRFARKGAALPDFRFALSLDGKISAALTGPGALLAIPQAAGKPFSVEFSEPGLFYLQSGTFPKEGGPQVFDLSKGIQATVSLLGKDGAPAAGSLALLEGYSKSAEGKEIWLRKIAVKTDAKGKTALVLPPGSYAMETSPANRKAFVAPVAKLPLVLSLKAN